jgi:HAD superfamily hydrolase (TIGR01450 family)
MLTDNEILLNIFQKEIFFFDLDGTLYLDDNLFPGVIELINYLRGEGKKIFFLSNNSSRSTADYLKKLKKLKLKAKKEELILSQHPTINYLKKNNFNRLFLLGNTSLKKEFREHGFELTDENPEILVLAFDQELTYDKLVKAGYFLQEGLQYIATHLDDRCPTERGFIPDAGGIAALLQKTAERMPKAFGKPNKEMLLFKLEELNLSRDGAIMFGDRIYTDIKMAKAAQIDICCVLSGETNIEMLEESNFKPEYVIKGIWELIELIK